MFRFLGRAKLALAGLCLAACLVFPSNAGAVISFFSESTGTLPTTLSSMTAQAVVRISGTASYRMYLSSGNIRILSATSPDLKSWTLEPGVRLSTGARHVDGSSITSCGISVSTGSTAPFLRMYYVAISTTGKYRILSATSTDGVTFNKTESTHVIRSGGTAFLDSPRPFADSLTIDRLYYISDTLGGNSRAQYRLFTSSSNDGGITHIASSVLSGFASDNVYHVSVTSLTDGRTRLYYNAPLTVGTTGFKILSAIAAAGSTSFSKESNVRYSTPSVSTELFYPVVVRTAESFSWRMFYSEITPDVSTHTFIATALAASPTLTGFTPSALSIGETSVSFTLTGEVFSTPNPTVTFTKSGDTIATLTLNRTNDLELTGTFSTLGKDAGTWTAVVTNADGFSTGSRPNAFTATLPPAEIVMLDNLFRPLAGGQVTVSITTFGSGRVKMTLYTQHGRFIRTLFDAETSAGNFAAVWNGTTLGGSVVASGVYLLKITAPGADIIKKIVVVK